MKLCTHRRNTTTCCSLAHVYNCQACPEIPVPSTRPANSTPQADHKRLLFLLALEHQLRQLYGLLLVQADGAQLLQILLIRVLASPGLRAVGLLPWPAQMGPYRAQLLCHRSLDQSPADSGSC